MIEDLLKFAFLIFVFFLIMIGWVAYAFYKQLTRARKQFNPYRQQQETQSNEPTITDNRPLEERNKQVIPDSEGEYVDFTEVEDDQQEWTHSIKVDKYVWEYIKVLTNQRYTLFICIKVSSLFEATSCSI